MKRLFVVAALLSAFTAIAAAPIAIRVEIEPVRVSGDGTVMAITVQVAPEDRSRIGKDAWIQGELRQRGERIERLARAVNLDDGGQARIEATWPPGVYQLQIEIEGSKRKGTGVWINTITVPNLEDTVQEAESPPRPLALPVTATPTTASAESPAEEAEQQPTPAAAEPVPAAAAVSATSTSPPAADMATASEPPIAIDPEVEESPKSAHAVEADETPSPAEVVSDGAKVAAAVSAAAVTVASVKPEPTAPSPESRTPSPEAEGPAESTSDDVTETVAAGAAAATAAASVKPEPTPPSPESRTPSPEPRDEEPATPPDLPPSPEWPIAADTTDLTVMVTDRNRPVVGLDTTSFSLKISGNDVAIHRIGEGQSAPLNLGLAVGVSETSSDTLGQVVRQLERLALRTGDGRAEVFLAATGDGGSIVVPWGATPEEVSNTVATASTGEQTGLSRAITDSVQAFQGRRGRSFLIVVSDGSDDSSKADWKETLLKATSAGIPVFVIGLSDTGFESRTRSSLGKLATVSGGRSYFLANAGMLELTLDYVGELIDSAYVLQFATQPGGGPVKVESGNRNWEVHHPSRIP